jgi:tyrosyl-tRNA synthetase
MNESTFLSVFEGVPVFDVKTDILQKGVTATDLCTVHTTVFPSKGELRRLIDGGGFSINKVKIDSADSIFNSGSLLNGKYLLIQKGKKNYYLIRVN